MTMSVDYIAHMGSDDAVCDAARVSMAKAAANFTADENARLIRYLARHQHWTPFSHPQITLRMKAPVPIRTQCFKHKVGFAENEESRRYIKSKPEMFVPDVFRSSPEGSVKQGSGGVHPKSEEWRRQYVKHCEWMVCLYEMMVGAGIAPEQARFVLPQGVMVQWIWTGSLAAYARFYKLRTDSHAQAEIRDLAEMVGEIIKPLFPVSWAALTEVEG